MFTHLGARKPPELRVYCGPGTFDASSLAEMGSRVRDWFDQATCDLGMARAAQVHGSHEWACFASHQSAEKSLKAYFIFAGGDAWGHALAKLLGDLPHGVDAPPEIMEAARTLDKFYIPTRYPGGFSEGKPADYFQEKDSNDAIACAERVHAWVDELIR